MKGWQLAVAFLLSSGLAIAATTIRNQDLPANLAITGLFTAGNVGIGTANPAQKLHLSSGTLLIDGNATDSVIVNGNVGIGTASPAALLDVEGSFKVSGATFNVVGGKILIGTDTAQGPVSDLLEVVDLGSGNNAGIRVEADGAAFTSMISYGSSFGAGYFLRTGGTGGTEASRVDSLNNNSLGQIVFRGMVDTEFSSPQNARIRAIADGNFTTGDTPSRLEFQTTPSGSTSLQTRMTIRNNGRVGIGTTEPATKLHISSGTLTIDGDPVGLTVGVSTFVVINGNVGIGVTNPDVKLHIRNGTTQITNENALALLLVTSFRDAQSQSGGSARINLRSANGTETAPTGIVSGDTLGEIAFRGHDGTQFPIDAGVFSGARIRARAEQNFTPTTLGNRLEFRTVPNGATSASTRLTIKNDGKIGIGTGSPSNPLTVSGNADFIGNVGIGTSSPASELDVGTGDIRQTSSTYMLSGSTRVVINYTETVGTRNALRIGITPEGIGTGHIGLNLFPSGLASTSTVIQNSSRNQICILACDPLLNPDCNSPGASFCSRLDERPGRGFGLLSSFNTRSDQNGVACGETRLLGNFSSSTSMIADACDDAGEGNEVRLRANTIRMLDNADVETMRIDSAGNVGIGTTNPEAALHVLKASGDAFIVSSGTAVSERLWIIESTGDLLPGTSGFQSIGSATAFVKDIFLSESSVKFVNASGVVTSSLSVSGSGALQFRGITVTDSSGDLDIESSELPADGYASIYVNVPGDTMTGTLTLSPASGDALVTTAGKVGIGITSPSSALHIKANTPGIVGSDPAGQIIIQALGTSLNSNAVITGCVSDGVGGCGEHLWYWGSSSGSNENNILLNRRNALLQLGTNSIARFTIDGAGDVGIGTASPATILHIKGPSAKLRLEGDAGDNPTLILRPGSGATNPSIEFHTSAGVVENFIAGGSSLRLESGNEVRLGAGGAIRVTLDVSGNVGIGATNPTTIFQVRDKPLEPGLFTAETNAGALIKSLTNNGGDTPSSPEAALILGRDGVASQSFGNFARFDLSRFENVATNSRTQLDIRLSDAILLTEGNDTPTIMSLRSNGNVGIGVVSPARTLDVEIVVHDDTGPMVMFNNRDANANDGSVLLLKGGSNNAASNILEIQDFNGNTDLVVLGTGLVGIGTASPASTSTLHVAGNLSVSGTIQSNDIFVSSQTPDTQPISIASLTDVVIASVTAVMTNKKANIRCVASGTNQSGGTKLHTMSIKEDGTIIDGTMTQSAANGVEHSLVMEYIITPTAAEHTYTCEMKTDNVTGTQESKWRSLIVDQRG